MTPGTVRIDLHVHTRHSHDSAAPVSSVLQRCEDSGLSLVAITDHNNIRGALEARERGGIPVIVGEEIKSLKGDVIGLFLEKRDTAWLDTRGNREASQGSGRTGWNPPSL